MDDLMQEPVAWMEPRTGEVCRTHWLEHNAPERAVDRFSLPLYTADQVREYAKRAVEAEREAILAMSEAEWFKSQFNYDEAIRARR